jgi:hypothetical protein
MGEFWGSDRTSYFHAHIKYLMYMKASRYGQLSERVDTNSFKTVRPFSRSYIWLDK